jgi:phenylacetate-CoA ligase
MRDQVLALYHRLPAPARSAAATLRGLYLHLWRYGRESEGLARQALQRDTWTPEQWRAWREERLGFVLHRAATRVPFYRDQWAERRRRGDHASPELLENWPILEKETVRSQPRAFVADDCNIRRMFHEQTSGTTGKPLDIWRTRSTVEALYALAGARADHWYGVPVTARFARLGGQLVTPVRQRRPPFWVWNVVMRQLYMSTYHLAPDLLPYYLDALKQYRITYLAGYTSSLVALAQEVLRTGRRDLRMLVAITNAEPLHDDQRKLIGEAFQCPVRETYGMTESVAAASECEHGRLHQWPEVGCIEVIEGQEAVAPGESGEFVCTGLLNPDMPLIRYRVGDRGQLRPSEERCPCGRTLPLVGRIDGRNSDVLFTRDGRRVWWLNPVFYGLPVRQSQIVQESLDRLLVRVAPDPDFGVRTEQLITDRLRSRMGEVAVKIERVNEIPRSSNGKLQAVVCRLTPEERASALVGTTARFSVSER